MNIEYVVNDETNPLEIPLHEGTYKFPTGLKDGQVVVLVSDADCGQEVFEAHREKFLKRILGRIVNRKPKVQDYIKFDVRVLNEKDVVFFDRIAWGEISYTLLSKCPFHCEFMFTTYPPREELILS